MLRTLIYAFCLCGLACQQAATEDDAGDDLSVKPAGLASTAVNFRAADGHTLYGTLCRPTEQSRTRRIALLFHQANSNRHEYDTIVLELIALGFDTLAIDQRSGGKMWGRDNQTVMSTKQSPPSYLEALPDLEAAVAWAVNENYDEIVCVGSSYSAALNFLLASRHGDELTAIACFSPGEYLGEDDLVKNAAAEVTIPIYVTAASTPEEQASVDEVLSKTDSNKITRHKANQGVHGASTLRADRNPGGWKENLADFREFLAGLTTP